ncbi:thioredoxin family protein [Nosocomiicoccus sp. HMSC059G07]|uniref:thioredoxin family protein n=1 Tax=Nosocomiicoccus sp. HMSC059G07 TaxID=1739531 RepID=UPI0008A48F21|nr:thioredoxin family protein [Nosocomiicoccus sp. HMSC059G07]OFO52717.1 hypothetical protein HMPREF3029_01920 [Nosocomiicoccus sp. HMSC059G07]
MANNLTEWYDKALSAEEMRQQFTDLKEGFDNIYDYFSVKEDEHKDELQEKNFKVLGIIEPWCAHCMLNTPILLRLAEAYDFEAKFVLRDENLDLMEQYQTNGKNIIPIYVVLDENNNEIGKWGPFAPEVKKTSDEAKKHIPSKDDPTYDEKFKKVIGELREQFKSDEALWEAAYKDIQKTLLDA